MELGFQFTRSPCVLFFCAFFPLLHVLAFRRSRGAVSGLCDLTTSFLLSGIRTPVAGLASPRSLRQGVDQLPFIERNLHGGAMRSVIMSFSTRARTGK